MWLALVKTFLFWPKFLLDFQIKALGLKEA